MILVLSVITIDSDLKKDENYHLQVFLKECKYIEKEVVRHITEDSFPSDSDEKSAFERAISTIFSLREQFSKCLLEGAYSKISFLVEQFRKCSFW